jgi:hypothetical protein
LLTDDHLASQHVGARRLLTAGLTVLLLALTVMTGMSVSPSSRVAITLEAIGGDRTPGVAVDDAGGAYAWVRSATFAKPIRSQILGLGGLGSDDDHPHLAALPSTGSHDIIFAVAREGDVSGVHRAASGQLTRRTPTGPPSPLSLAT